MLQLSCLDNYLIQIVRANYGRFSIEICNEMGRTDFSVNCISNQSSYILQQRYVQNTIIFSLKNIYYLLTTSLLSIGFYKYVVVFFHFQPLLRNIVISCQKEPHNFLNRLRLLSLISNPYPSIKWRVLLGFPSRIFFLQQYSHLRIPTFFWRGIF